MGGRLRIGSERKGREGREMGGRARLGYLSRGPLVHSYDTGSRSQRNVTYHKTLKCVKFSS